MNIEGFSEAKLGFDIGAYDGGVAKAYLDIGVKELVCVEPNPYTYYRLFNRFTDTDNVHLVDKLLSSSVATDIIFFSSTRHPQISTANKEFITNSRYANQMDENDVLFEWDHTYRVDTTTIDKLIEEYGTPQFIKVDTVGDEHNTFLGLTDLYPGTTIMFKVREEFLPTTYECIEYLHKLGYNKFGLIGGDRVGDLPSRYHDMQNFTKRLKRAFPKPNNNFLGTIFTKYENK